MRLGDSRRNLKVKSVWCASSSTKFNRLSIHFEFCSFLKDSFGSCGETPSPLPSPPSHPSQRSLYCLWIGGVEGMTDEEIRTVFSQFDNVVELTTRASPVGGLSLLPFPFFFALDDQFLILFREQAPGLHHLHSLSDCRHAHRTRSLSPSSCSHSYTTLHSPLGRHSLLSHPHLPHFLLLLSSS